jgi:hypothetical protein
MAIREEVIVIGEQWADGPQAGSLSEGRVHVYNLFTGSVDTLKSPNPKARAEFGCYIDINEEMIAVSDRSTVNEEKKAGRIYIFQLVGTEAQKPPDKITDESDTNKWIPGFPLTSLVFGLALLYLFIHSSSNKSVFTRMH